MIAVVELVPAMVVNPDCYGLQLGEMAVLPLAGDEIRLSDEQWRSLGYSRNPGAVTVCRREFGQFEDGTPRCILYLYHRLGRLVDRI